MIIYLESLRESTELQTREMGNEASYKIHRCLTIAFLHVNITQLEDTVEEFPTATKV